MNANRKQKNSKEFEKKINIIFMPVKPGDCTNLHVLDDIRETTAQIILLSTKRGRPKKENKEDDNAA
jgi:hypothetical protein